MRQLCKERKNDLLVLPYIFLSFFVICTCRNDAIREKLKGWEHMPRTVNNNRSHNYSPADITGLNFRNQQGLQYNGALFSVHLQFVVCIMPSSETTVRAPRLQEQIKTHPPSNILPFSKFAFKVLTLVSVPNKL